MTSDAKIGLLLGLGFIFIIALIINGLPKFGKNENNNELTTNLVNLQDDLHGIAARERKAREAFNHINLPQKQPLKVENSFVTNEGIRSIIPLPNNTETNSQKVKFASAQSLSETEQKQFSKSRPARTSSGKTYIVCEGDNLAVIAKKFYGTEEGNRHVNIARIFNVNRGLMKSSDEIYVGQKIVIPPLLASATDKSGHGSVFPATMFKKVESIGHRNLKTDNHKKTQNSRYVVREGDSLWRIASEQLGQGSRYAEIAKLNAGSLDDEDDLVVGMHLKIPVQ